MASYLYINIHTWHAMEFRGLCRALLQRKWFAVGTQGQLGILALFARQNEGAVLIAHVSQGYVTAYFQSFFSGWLLSV